MERKKPLPIELKEAYYEFLPYSTKAIARELYQQAERGISEGFQENFTRENLNYFKWRFSTRN